MLRKVPLTTALMALFAVGVLLGAACSDDDDDAGAQDADLTAVQGQAEKAMVLAATNGLSAIGLHEIDEELQTASEIPEGVSGDIERAHQITVGTDWPEDLAEGATELEAALADFMAAVEDEDLEAAKGYATDTHAAWHDLDHAALAFYAGDEHSEDDSHTDEEADDHGSEDEGEGHDEEAGATPEA